MGDGIGIESRLNLPERFRYERVVRKAKDYRPATGGSSPI